MFEIGSSLREARLRQALDLADAEQGTKIRSKYLRALEDERFELLPAQTYVKGFLRSYADFLGLDGQLYVDEFNSRYVTGEDEVLPRTRRSSTSSTHRRVETSALLFALAGIAAAAALVVVAWRFGSGEEARMPDLGPAPSPVEEQTPASQPRAQTRRRPWIAVEVAATQGSSSLAVYRVLRGRQKLIYNDILEHGQRRRFTGPRLSLDVSNPENLVFRHNEAPVALPLRRAPIVLVATRQGIAPARGR